MRQPPDPLELALTALGRKERTTLELGAWLAERGCEDVDAVIVHLTEVGALDDERFARVYAEDKRDLSGWGPERIREALQARGVDPETAEAAAAEAGPQEQVERAATLLTRRGDELGDDRGRSRAFAFLTRRGFAHEVAYAAIRHASQASRTAG